MHGAETVGCCGLFACVGVRLAVRGHPGIPDINEGRKVDPEAVAALQQDMVSAATATGQCHRVV